MSIPALLYICIPFEFFVSPTSSHQYECCYGSVFEMVCQIVYQLIIPGFECPD